MPTPARQLYFEGVKVGDELIPMVKPPVERVQLVRYAAASGDFNPLHIDELAAKHAGFPSVFAPGMLPMSYCAQLAQEWLRGARIVKFGARFIKMVWPGDVLTLRGRVLDRHFQGAGRYLADLEIWAENQRGELVVRSNILAQLFYNAEDESRQRSGQGPLVISKEEEEARLARYARPTRKVAVAPARPSFPTLTPVQSKPGNVRVASKPSSAGAKARQAASAKKSKVTNVKAVKVARPAKAAKRVSRPAPKKPASKR